MSDNLSKRSGPDRSKINMHKEFEVRHWIKHFGVTKEELARAVEKVGNSAATARKELRVQNLPRHPHQGGAPIKPLG